MWKLDVEACCARSVGGQRNGNLACWNGSLRWAGKFRVLIHGCGLFKIMDVTYEFVKVGKMDQKVRVLGQNLAFPLIQY
jgi:hypothetical protein